ncbi:hypothetical protein NBRC116602_09430 [Hyphomicrobiales bacterium 4NK60-0047b]|jgi:hypothetical protein
MTKFFTIAALGLLTLNVYAPASFAGGDRSQANKGIVFEKQECPEGETWSDEKKVCEKKVETK